MAFHVASELMSARDFLSFQINAIWWAMLDGGCSVLILSQDRSPVNCIKPPIVQLGLVVANPWRRKCSSTRPRVLAATFYLGFTKHRSGDMQYTWLPFLLPWSNVHLYVCYCFVEVSVLRQVLGIQTLIVSTVLPCWLGKFLLMRWFPVVFPIVDYVVYVCVY